MDFSEARQHLRPGALPGAPFENLPQTETAYYTWVPGANHDHFFFRTRIVPLTVTRETG
jgi:hypothetical protein